MTPAEHYAEAERVLATLDSEPVRALTDGAGVVAFNLILGAAQVHATLALAPAPVKAEPARDAELPAEGEWPFGTAAAAILVARTGNPNEMVESIIDWGPRLLPTDPEVFRIEVDRAQTRLAQAIKHLRAALTEAGGD